MSTIIMAAVWPLQGMSAAQKAVLVSLADQANDDGACWPAVDTIALRTCLSERAVQEALRWLQSTGAVFRQYRENKSSVYTVTPQSFDPAKAPSKRDRAKSPRGADGAPPANGAPDARGAPPEASAPPADSAPGAAGAPGGADGAPGSGKWRTPGVQEAHRGVANGAPKSSMEPSLNRKGTINEPPSSSQPAAQAGGGEGEVARLEAYRQACRETWAAYELAYQQRYDVAPVRNAKVNTAIGQLVKRLGAVEAPAVAAWFVGNVNQAFVVQRCHAVGDLLAQCESYRTQWAAGRAVTQTEAQQADKTAANHGAAGRAGVKALAILERRRQEQEGAQC